MIKSLKRNMNFQSVLTWSREYVIQSFYDEPRIKLKRWRRLYENRETKPAEMATNTQNRVINTSSAPTIAAPSQSIWRKLHPWSVDTQQRCICRSTLVALSLPEQSSSTWLRKTDIISYKREKKKRIEYPIPKNIDPGRERKNKGIKTNPMEMKLNHWIFSSI